MIRRLTAECAGTFWLVLMGCGCSALAAGSFVADPGVLAQSIAFGLAMTAASYLLGPISGAHFNPAVTVGLAVANRFPVRDLVPYILAQLAGATSGAALLYFLARARPGFELYAPSFGVNGYDSHSPGNYQLHAAFVIEAVMTFAFVIVKLATSAGRAFRVGGPLIVGLTLALIYVVTMPVTGASVNPARSTGPALVVGGWALDELWLFWAAPLAGGILAGVSFPLLFGRGAREGTKTADRKFSDLPQR
ncbi:MIP family channel protein [Caballeronia humi]|uniref:Aquaporin Z n=1 Tax=Caballeronia humi TaxID=326474 RepID=A0A158F0B2_9BURK|nr:MIP family channel protein [Caballeronia humi]SAL13268.1 aquaporin Z [Caballeronia humi]